jgi:hypothetical protein
VAERVTLWQQTYFAKAAPSPAKEENHSVWENRATFNRQAEIDRFYQILDVNVNRRHRQTLLGALDSLKSLPELQASGIYFLFERGEMRSGAPGRQKSRSSNPRTDESAARMGLN